VKISLFQTATFRLTVIASLAFMIAGGAVLAFVYWDVLRSIDADINGALRRDTADMTAVFRHGGYDGLRYAVAARASLQPDALRFYILEGSHGELTGNVKRWPNDAPSPGIAANIDLQHDGGEAAPARVQTLNFDGGIRFLFGRSLAQRNKFRDVVSASLLTVLAANLLIGGAAGLMLARYALRRLDRINAAAGVVLEGNLSVRIPARPGGGEYDNLAHSFNIMLDRVEGLVATVRGVTENIAHDLRTPLNRLRSRLEVALMAPRSEEEYRSIVSRAIGELETITGTFNGILKIARMKAGALALPKAPVDLAAVAMELTDLYEVFAEENGVSLEARMPRDGEAPQNITVQGDAHLISQAAANLLDNAIKYSPKGGKVVIEVARSGQGISLSVNDSGSGIPVEKRTVILERFVRLQAASDREGYGLGLNFASAVAGWHGARLELASNNPGLRATLYFPTAKI
jgi:signal transduction histidine kinase